MMTGDIQLENRNQCGATAEYSERKKHIHKKTKKNINIKSLNISRSTASGEEGNTGRSSLFPPTESKIHTKDAKPVVACSPLCHCGSRYADFEFSRQGPASL